MFYFHPQLVPKSFYIISSSNLKNKTKKVGIDYIPRLWSNIFIGSSFSFFLFLFSLQIKGGVRRERRGG